MIWMERPEILERLRANEAGLRRRGVAHAALFGSRARGDHRPDSDIDILIEVEPDTRIGLWAYVDLKDHVAALFDGRVDVVGRDGLKPHLGAAVVRDAIDAF